MKNFQAYLFRIFCIRTSSLPSLFLILSITFHTVLHFFWRTQRWIYLPYYNRSVSSEYIPGIYLLLHIIKTGVIAVGDDGMALGLERRQVVDHIAAEEGGAVFERRLIDDNLGALCLDTLLDALLGILQVEAAGIAHRDGTLDNHHSIRVHFLYQADHLFHMGCVEVVLYRVIVGWRRDDHEVGILICRLAIKGCSKVEWLLCQIFLYIVVLNRTKYGY